MWKEHKHSAMEEGGRQSLRMLRREKGAGARPPARSGPVVGAGGVGRRKDADLEF